MSTPQPNPSQASAEPPAPSTTQPSVPPTPAPSSVKPRKTNALRWIIIGVVALLALIVGIPWVIQVLNTVSTDDAYVNGHVTFVAPRVGGQVARVLVDDNNRVHKGDLLVQLDKEPFQVQVNIAQAAVDAAQADLVAARAQTRAVEGQARSLRYSLEHAIEDVGNQVAILRSKVATLKSKQAELKKAQADYDRNLPLVKSGTVTPQDFDAYTEALLVARAERDEALQGIYQVRAALGLPAVPESGEDLAEVPADLDQTFSSVREVQAKLIQVAAQLAVPFNSFDKTPKQMLEDFYKLDPLYEQDPKGSIDRIYAKLLERAPAVKQAETKVEEAKRNLDEAKLNLRYCRVLAEIEGVITRREVNPGNNVVAGQSLMAI